MVQVPANSSRMGLALAGGGPQGAVYEIGALLALEEAIEGLRFTDLDVFVGVSAGAFIASNLANQMSPVHLCRSLIKTEPGEHPFQPSLFLKPAFGEYVRSGLNLPAYLWEVALDYLGNRQDRTLLKSLTKLGRAIPVGLFDNEPIKKFLEQVFSRKGRTNDFRELKQKLYIVAVELDSGESIIFGKEGHDHIPISLAVQASTALPGLYPPVVIDDRHYVDGVLLKTLHTSTILETGIDLAICINPIVPVNTRTSVESGYMRRGKLIDRGMPSVLSQTFRTMIHSRMELGISSYKSRYQGTDILLIEPSKEDYRMFFTNIFSFSSRKSVCEHAYRSTIKDLYKRKDEVNEILKRHGLFLKPEADLEIESKRLNRIWNKQDDKELPVLQKLDESLELLRKHIDLKTNS